jgi:hypothetical protein
MRISLPRSNETAPRIQTTSNAGSYAATFVVGVVGFVVGNLALDAIKEQIHHNTVQSSSHSASVWPPPLATQLEPSPPAVAPPNSTGPSSWAIQPKSTSDADRLQQRESAGLQSAQVSLLNPVAPTATSPEERGSGGPIASSNTAIADASVDVGKSDPSNAIANPPGPNLAESFYRRGIADGQNRSYDKALADLSEAIRLDPMSAPAYYNRGVTYWQRGNRDRATADFNEAIRLDPKLAVAYYGRGCGYMYYGQKVKAEMDFAQAKRLGYTSPKPNSTNR